jgi:hypothetical protein
MFFWGGKAARARATVQPALDPDGCLARSVLRSQPQIEETDAVRTLPLEQAEDRIGGRRRQTIIRAP